MMKRIAQLTTVLSNQIAAGEVVERPASVVKELVENSLDALSTQIDIDIEGGGVHLIRVTDNGHGIVKADLPLAFARHATSKISTIQDLGAIATLGFRGEALASVASVSRCRLVSKALHETSAWQIQLSPDMTTTILPAAHAQGTTVEIADLFYNTPVRRKFIRSEKSEFQAIDDTVKRLALSYPEVSIRLKHQGKQLRHYPGTSARVSEISRVEKICGQAFVEQALSLELTAYGVKLRGWLSPALMRRQADCQYFFINQRMVKDRLLNHVIKTVYQQQLGLQEGTYPSYVLYLNVEPSEVDVNVHPTKQEVRFSQPRYIHDFISKALSEALGQHVESPLNIEKSVYVSNKRAASLPTSNAPVGLQPITVKAQRYALIEDEQGLTIYDLYKGKNALIKNYFLQSWGHIPNKPLLFPFEITLPQANLLDNAICHRLSEIGYLIKKDEKKLTVLAAPLISLHTNPSEFLLALINEMKIDQTQLHLCEWLAEHLSKQSLSTIDNQTLSLLLKISINEQKIGAWRQYSHAEFEQMIDLPSTN